MPIRPSKGKRPINFELPNDVADALDEFVRSRNERKGDVITLAIRRHMANPPPEPELPPLPPVGTPKKRKSS